tara:strand:+ start:109 stop:726 length:618 start_codon:yes stop_codon:yes gene_type:complete
MAFIIRDKSHYILWHMICCLNVMILRHSIFLSTILLLFFSYSCKESKAIENKQLNGTSLSNSKEIEIVDFDGLFNKIDLSVDKTYVLNFWATWCAPCVKELPYFEIVNNEYKDKNVEVILVSLDFPNQIESKLNPYLYKNNIKSDVILLDDPEIGTWVSKVSDDWDGGIPATLIVNSDNYNFYPKPFEKEELISEINKILPRLDK